MFHEPVLVCMRPPIHSSCVLFLRSISLLPLSLSLSLSEFSFSPLSIFIARRCPWKEEGIEVKPVWVHVACGLKDIQRLCTKGAWDHMCSNCEHSVTFMGILYKRGRLAIKSSTCPQNDSFTHASSSFIKCEDSQIHNSASDHWWCRSQIESMKQHTFGEGGNLEVFVGFPARCLFRSCLA